jgi:hypothetical protein
MTLRKRIGGMTSQPESRHWLRLEDVAHVEVSSEHPEWPIDGALLEGGTAGWRAGHPGEQRLRIHFDTPGPVSHVHVVFDEADRERVQEFALQWSDDGGSTFRPLIRQQFSFSPGGATREVEDYSCHLTAVTDFELHINPDISNHSAVATLTALRLR